MEKPKMTWIDSLKGIAICGIVMVHSDTLGLPWLLEKIGDAGKCGVQLFFLLSSYLTFVSLEHYFNTKTSSRAISFHHLIPW